MMLEICCVPKPAKEDEKIVVIFAIEGTPQVAATLDAMMKKHWPGDSMDADQARAFGDAFVARLKYYVTPTALTVGKEKEYRWGSPPGAVTGVLSERDGRKWITPSKIQSATLKYPSKWIQRDTPLKPAGKTSLALKVTDTLSLKCILLPAGKFIMRQPYYAVPRWQDEVPHLVTLTKPFWLAEIPVTQEMYEAVMGDNPSEIKDPQRPVRNVACTDINKFCRILSERNVGRKVRLPTEAEWEYAARVGTSNPPLWERFKDQCSDGAGSKKPLLPVKSRKPNAWGLYDMVSSVFEITCDKFVFRNTDCVDPYDSCEQAEASGKKHGHWDKGANSGKCVNYHEDVGTGAAKSDAEYTTTKFRVLVEATEAEIAELEKASAMPR
jgi:formylglycine-generating enzyme required for sulfatase activity